MKRILVTSSSSFVGSSVSRYLASFPEKYSITSLSIRDGKWKDMDFSGYDVIFHVAGLAHSDTGKISDADRAKYYEINTDLTASVARKAKESGVGQFIFMSSAIVYGDSAAIGKDKIITRDTPCSPANAYGDSKVQAEKRLAELSSEQFRVVILRCPMIYGRGGKGNFPILEKIARKLPAFPKVSNRRSMLYIGNLAEFVRLMIDNEESGLFWPCNREWSNTSELVREIAACHGKRIALIPGTAWMLKMLSHVTGAVNKAFGNLTYEEHLGDYREDYRLYSLAESIKETER